MKIEMSKLSIVASLATLLLVTATCGAQNFDPRMNDKVYLDRIHLQLHKEVEDARRLLVSEAKVLQQVTQDFIEQKIRENLFKAVRERVEIELDKTATTNITRQARQEEDDDDDSSSTTTQRNRPGLLPQLSQAVSAIFGADVNVTEYVKSATAFLPLDLSNRLIGAVSLIDPNRFTSTMPPPTLVTINGTQYAYDAATGTLSFPPPGTPGVSQGQRVVVVGSSVAGVPNGVGVVGISNQGVGGGVPIQNYAGAFPNGVQNGVSNANGGIVTNGIIPNPAVGVTQNQGVGISVPNQVFGSIPNTAPATNQVVGGAGYVQNQGGIGLIPLGNGQQPALPIADTGLPVRSSSEDEDDNNSEASSGGKNPQDEETSGESSEDDLAAPVQQDDESSGGFLDEYYPVKYVVNLYNRLTKSEIPTTTEYRKTTPKGNITEYYDDDEPPTTTLKSTYAMIVQSGVYLYEGAREAYQLLQQVNKYLDRVNERFEAAGLGAEEVGVDVL